MNYPVQLSTVGCSSIRATQRTEWFFLEVSDSAGLTEVVEITCGDGSYRALEDLSEMLCGLRGIICSSFVIASKAEQSRFLRGIAGRRRPSPDLLSILF